MTERRKNRRPTRSLGQIFRNVKRQFEAFLIRPRGKMRGRPVVECSRMDARYFIIIHSLGRRSGQLGKVAAAGCGRRASRSRIINFRVLFTALRAVSEKSTAIKARATLLPRSFRVSSLLRNRFFLLNINK